MAARRIASFARRRAAHLRVGRRGERLARRLLRELGMEVLGGNYRGPRGEIDIVARDGKLLCFVEVKTRRASSGARPAAGLVPAQKWRIVRTAERYLRQLGHPPVLYRFDLVEIVVDGWRVVEARHWPNEFSAARLKRLPDGRVVEVDV